MSTGAVDVCSEILVPESFYRHSHGLIFRAILDVAEKGEPVDALTVVGRLDADGKLAAAGGAERVHELSVLTPAASNAAHYAKIVRAMWLRREIASVGHELVALGDNGAESVTDLFGEIDKRFLRLQSQGTRKKDRVFTAKQLVAEYRETLANPLDENEIGVKAPFSFLSPLMGSRLYVIGGYTGHGKSVSGISSSPRPARAGLGWGFTQSR
jgi:replicative DNA helicase